MTSNLVHNGIYAAMIGDLRPGRFHWMMYIAEGASGGWVLHAIDQPVVGVFHFVKERWTDLNRRGVMAYVKIGQIMDGLDVDSVCEYVKDIQCSVVPPGQRDRGERAFSCRVWFKEAIRILNEAEMFVQCADVNALEGEIITFAVKAQYGGRIEYAVASNARSWP
ncbi:hypothetical protein FA15DRAFT_645940 [Coprinopsis marcescibilis]|uniref:Uncharacterized protein n=1 Tax=Coprinopsis marcescibilis TaxID=230819 RepID=A0A5C3KM91_COPMA|nr:hypothetical protein FA15DRAFT_645940 [Coprinopsis marcescibilis]